MFIIINSALDIFMIKIATAGTDGPLTSPKEEDKSSVMRQESPADQTTLRTSNRVRQETPLNRRIQTRIPGWLSAKPNDRSPAVLQEIEEYDEDKLSQLGITLYRDIPEKKVDTSTANLSEEP